MSNIHNHVSKLDKQKLQVEAAQFVFGLNPQTLLTIDLAAPVCLKTAATFRTDVTLRPASLPKLTPRGGRIFIKMSDLLEFVNGQDSQPQKQKRVGRPTNAHKVAGGAHGR